MPLPYMNRDPGDNFLILASALKHGIKEEDIRFSLSQPSSSQQLREDPPKWLYTGYSQAGIPLEIIVVINDDGTIIVIHAMKLRRQYHHRKNRP